MKYGNLSTITMSINQMKTKVINFDYIVNRSDVPTLKFDGETMQGVFGSDNLWPSWVADMDFKAAPEVIEALSRRVDHGVFGYEVSRGDIRRAVARWYQNRYAWSFDAEHIVSTPRTLNSLAVLISPFVHHPLKMLAAVGHQGRALENQARPGRCRRVR